jgi:hypothetical protein
MAFEPFREDFSVQLTLGQEKTSQRSFGEYENTCRFSPNADTQHRWSGR